MASVKFSINNKIYSVDCGEGQEDTVRRIAALIDMKAQALVAQFGQVDNETLLLMVLILAFTDLEKSRAALAKTPNEGELAEAVLEMAAKIKRITTEVKNG